MQGLNQRIFVFSIRHNESVGKVPSGQDGPVSSEIASVQTAKFSEFGHFAQSQYAVCQAPIHTGDLFYRFNARFRRLDGANAEQAFGAPGQSVLKPLLCCD